MVTRRTRSFRRENLLEIRLVPRGHPPCRFLRTIGLNTCFSSNHKWASILYRSELLQENWERITQLHKLGHTRALFVRHCKKLTTTRKRGKHSTKTRETDRKHFIKTTEDLHALLDWYGGLQMPHSLQDTQTFDMHLASDLVALQGRSQERPGSIRWLQMYHRAERRRDLRDMCVQFG